MQDILLENYAWLRAIHVIAVISFMAGMLYLPRLYVYHANAIKGSDLSETLKIMERKLLRFIINPAFIIALLIGGLMVWANNALLNEPWFHAKLTLLFFMGGVHGLYAKWRKDFARDSNKHTAKFYRIWNEIPTILMIGIVILVIVRPF